MSVNGSACANVTVSASLTSLTCIAPPGAGSAPLVVTVGGLQGTTLLQYNAPVVRAVSASPVEAAATFTLGVYGSDLGFPDVEYRGSTTVFVGA